jgi:hypothetical protein
MILDKLLSENDFNDLMIQQEKSNVIDPLGLYTVLKNIQGRKCSCGFLCIEIGTIYGNFDTLKPKNVTIPFHEKENVHMIIKPIVVVNNTQPSIEPKNNSIKIVDLFENDDCDELKMSSFPRFKQVGNGVIVKRQDIQRKFYRKVGIGEDVYSQETFKQGLNLLIIQRDRKYTKRIFKL